MLTKNPFFLYTLKFLGAFCFLYFGTQLVIGLSAPGGHYSSFVHDYLNYPALLRTSLLLAAKFSLYVMGYGAYIHDVYFIAMNRGHGVRMVYSCLGIGVLSFWTAFIYANKGSGKKKVAWIALGLLLIWLINVMRVVLLLMSVNGKWPMPFNIDNHTFFNIGAYLAIFVLIYFYYRSDKPRLSASNG